MIELYVFYYLFKALYPSCRDFFSNTCDFVSSIFGHPVTGYILIGYALLTYFVIWVSRPKMRTNEDVLCKPLSTGDAVMWWFFAGLWGGHWAYVNVYPKLRYSIWIYLMTLFSFLCFSVVVLLLNYEMIEILRPLLVSIMRISHFHFLDNWAIHSMDISVKFEKTVEMVCKFVVFSNAISIVYLPSAVSDINAKYYRQ